MLLLDFFLNKYVRELAKGPMQFSKKALKSLTEYAWPGNVRELQNLVHRLVIMADEDTIDTPDLPENFRYSATRSRGLNRKLADIERDYISDVLAANKNNISHTAQILGIDRKTLREKLKKTKD
jgi:DNA-binding NtrC family response regulator